LLGRAAPNPRLTLHFASPATFKSGGLHVPVPLPGLVFGGLLER
jgi:CRISPR-associated endoribonuclease Cas6